MNACVAMLITKMQNSEQMHHQREQESFPNDKSSFSEEDITRRNVNTHKSKVSKQIIQKLIELKGEINRAQSLLEILTLLSQELKLSLDNKLGIWKIWTTLSTALT